MGSNYITDSDSLKVICEAAGIENYAEVAEALSKIETATKGVETAQRQLKQGTFDFTEVLELQAQKEVNLADLSQEINRRMRERRETMQAVRSALDEVIAKEQELADVVARNQATINELSGKEGDGGGFGAGGGTGFAGLAGNVMRAEKAIHAISSGSGLGRLGGMLEPIAAALGGPAGIGVAIAAILYELEPAIPKVKAFFDAWEKGIKPIDDVTDALHRFDQAQGDPAKKRALARVDRQLSKLEDKEDDQGWLSPVDRDKLHALREKSQEAHEAADLDAAVGSTGPSEAQSKRASAVRKAMAESGGGISAVSDLEKSGEDPKMARQIVADALQGVLGAIERVQSSSTKFSSQYAFVDPVATRTRREQEAGNKTIADVEAKTAKNVEHLEHEKRREFDQTMAENQREIDRYDREQDHAKRDHDRKRELAKKDQERNDVRNTRENTPEAINRRAMATQQNEIMGAVQNVDRANQAAGGQAASADFLNQVTRQASRNVTMGADLASAVNMAIDQVQQKIAADFARGMQQQYRSHQILGSPY